MDDFELVFNVFFGNLVDFLRFGVKPSSEPVNSTVLRRRFLAANFFARIFRLLIFLARLEWQSFTLKSKSLSRSLSDSLGVISEKSSSLSASSSSDDRSPVFSVELFASSGALRFRDASRSKPLVDCDFDETIEFRAFFLPVLDCTVDVVVFVALLDVANLDFFFKSRFVPSAELASGFSSFGASAYVYGV